ncbi:hypothetical protein [Kitasatospora fiedleri]|uniref:hypothetical protein n=1 Tax=Kitasatospora fiedleri TaxID=2991545 RepID=UPI00249A6C33|nr:hypothetical protein [Kitasatospora fiedleri]
MVGASLLLYPLLAARKAAREKADAERAVAIAAAGTKAYGLSEWRPDSAHSDRAATGTGTDSVEA